MTDLAFDEMRNQSSRPRPQRWRSKLQMIESQPESPIAPA